MAEKKFKWIFPENADSLLPDPDLILAFPSTVIKQNPVRSVCKATNPENGEVFYIKYDTPRSFLKKCCNLFYSKSRQEFHAAGLLRKLNLPVIRYEACGERTSGSCLISREIKNYCSAAQFWYALSSDDSAKPQRKKFIAALTALLKTLNENKILHPDFHLGNLMCNPNDPEKLLLPDPYGIRKACFRNVAAYNSIVVTNLAAEIRAEEGQEILRATGADPALWDNLLLKNKNMINAQWQRRMKQILTGNSKFSRTESINGVEYQIRNSRWFAPVPFTPEACKQVSMPKEEALKIWLESFRKEMLYDIKGHPKAICIMDKDAILFY